MFSNTQPAALHELSGNSVDEFRVTLEAEVVALLHRLQDANALVHLSGPDGSVYSTTVWTVDAQQQKISFNADDASSHLQHLIDSGEATVVGYIDSIKLQFDVRDLLLVRGARACALQARLPRELFRFQRRSSFRVRTLERTAPTAHLRHPTVAGLLLDLRVLDVSIGGCALFLPDSVPPLPPGVRIPQVRIALDADTHFEASLLLHHVTATNPRSEGTRLGCSMEDLSGQAQRTLQLYIDHTQKRRRLLSLD